MTKQGKDYSVPTTGGVYYYRSPISIGLEPLGYALLASMGLAVGGTAVVVGLGDWRDPTAWKLLVLITGLPWLILSWYQIRRLVARQVRDLRQYDTLYQVPEPTVLDITPPEKPGLRIPPPPPPAPSEEQRARELARLLLQRHYAGLPATRDAVQDLNIATPKMWTLATKLLKVLGLREGYSFPLQDPQAALLLFDTRAGDFVLRGDEWGQLADSRFRFGSAPWTAETREAEAD